MELPPDHEYIPDMDDLFAVSTADFFAKRPLKEATYNPYNDSAVQAMIQALKKEEAALRSSKKMKSEVGPNNDSVKAVNEVRQSTQERETTKDAKPGSLTSSKHKPFIEPEPLTIANPAAITKPKPAKPVRDSKSTAKPQPKSIANRNLGRTSQLHEGSTSSEA